MLLLMLSLSLDLPLFLEAPNLFWLRLDPTGKPVRSADIFLLSATLPPPSSISSHEDMVPGTAKALLPSR